MGLTRLANRPADDEIQAEGARHRHTLCGCTVHGVLCDVGGPAHPDGDAPGKPLHH